MFDLFFGLIWTVVSALIGIAMYSGDHGVEVNGVWVPQEEFNQMLWPKLFIGMFLFIGLIFLIKGLKNLFTNMGTSVSGKETYGVIRDIYRSNMVVNGRPVLNADVEIVAEDGCRSVYTESIGTSSYKYAVGDCLLVKHHKNDINIISKVDKYEIPANIRASLGLDEDWERPTSQQTAADIIVINGVEYIKKN